MNLSIYIDARARVKVALKEIERLKQSEFPYKHPQEALDNIEAGLKNISDALGKVLPTTNHLVVQNICRDSLRELHIYVPILGFVLRATNIRNAFEVYGPLQRLAYAIMGPDTKLIVSSEWEYSPFVYRAIKGLSGFVLIGLPAPESSNPLLIPLAGHELGHSVWGEKSISSEYQDQIEDSIIKELVDNRWDDYKKLYPQHKKQDITSKKTDSRVTDARLTWRLAYAWALLQTEETFCDFLGLRLFAESYLYAFAYMLSPGISGIRSQRYPNIKRRVANLVKAAHEMGVEVPDNYESVFIEELEPTSLLILLADHAASSLVDPLIQSVIDLVNSANIPLKNASKVKEISRSFRDWIVPTSIKYSLCDIVNAGWECNLDEQLWEGVSQIQDGEKARILRDIVLKSMEINEIYDCMDSQL